MHLSNIVISSPIGNIAITSTEDKITAIEFVSNSIATKSPKTTFQQHIAHALERYFSNPISDFPNLPVNLTGTPFQRTVWQALQQIPSGKTITYGELAKQLQTAPRAIGQACKKNPLPIIIPCHRVVGSTKIGGYHGAIEGKFFEIKTWLLHHEKIS